MTDTPNPLSPSQLHKACNPEEFDFDTTDDLPDVEAAIGQERALDALRFGLKIAQEGFNVFALGPSGLGKASAIRSVIENEARNQKIPDDWCYVNNFAEPAKPIALRLPAGQGRKYAHDLEQLIEELKTAIPAAFEGEEYRARAEEIEEEGKEREASAVNELRLKALPEQIALLETPTGFAFAPINEKSEVLSPDAFHQLPEPRQREIQETIADLHEQLQKLLRQFPAWRRETKQRLNALQHEIAGFAVGHFIDELKSTYAAVADAGHHIEAIRQALIEHADEFIHSREESLQPLLSQARINPFLRYRVNLLVDHSETKSPPLLFERLPTHANLIGRVEHQAHMGTLLTDFTMIRPGALHRANGGYLVLDARKLLLQPFAWDTLKRTLQAGEIRIESLERTLSLISGVSLEPEPIPLDIKLVLTGDRLLYYLLSFYDPEFGELFKVSADFEDAVDRNPDSQRLYARFIAGMARRSRLKPLDRAAVIRVIEQASRWAEDAEKMSAHLRSLDDLLKEANHRAEDRQSDRIASEDIQSAIDHRIERASRLRDRIYEEIHRGTLFIDTVGRTIGQVNGLSVISLGDYSFGQPSRITATTRLGGGKIIDIEREAELSGAIHSKGVMILSALLGSRYARVHPMSLNATLVFEQSYGEVEGDSASLAELCAILSSLAELPVRQSLAVTGSINQLGQVQPVGGINEKIEGFFDICRTTGLNGQQGVIIPAANVKHLMLRADVVEATSRNQFQVFAVQNVDEALALLLDTAAGTRNDLGEFPMGTVNSRVEQRLREWAAIAIQLSHLEENGG